MFRRLAVAAFALSVAACASKQKAPEGNTQGAPVSKETRARLNNLTYFDLATCNPRPLKAPEPANQPGIIGAVVATRPQVLECLVDPKNRGPAETTRVVVNATVDQTQAKFAVSGDNMTPTGTACVEKVLAERIPLKPLPAGAQPVTAQAEIVHGGRAPAVTMGINPASDIAGTIRLNQPHFCECYADYQDSVPPELKVALDLPAKATKLSPPAFEPAPGAEKLTACLTQKLQALDFTATDAETKLPAYPFFAINSNAGEAAAGLAEDLRFTHLDAVRGQRVADVAMAVGSRVNAVTTYDAAVVAYKANPKKVNPQELVDKCAALVKADDTWIASLTKQGELADRTLAFVQESKAKDPAWGEVEAPAQAQVDTAKKDLAEAQAAKVADQKVCPKVSYKQK
ncbi:hypothetical protein FGE12_08960 [Aggregicoccus sp. 17bor-14]|uniref:hypothetical protein n=1 Tax=Myxococcaceae TaxID=31 RepID=UPI00129CC042|nr:MULTISPECIES: hypothetical protein [Myxococcaceae]MBF5042529.1 hypothetical protein [Simulacricoccus sp. 17bor-14]MRI88299.1 hypothetical protein [Aggregicoccus sp. 17bor-14]